MTAGGSSSRGLAPELAAALAYLFGAVSGIALLITEKDDRFVRFHAMQSTVTFGLVLAFQLALSGLPVLGKVLYRPFVVGVVLLWAFLMYQAFQKRMYKLPYIGDFAEQQIR